MTVSARESAGGIIVNSEGKIVLVEQHGDSWTFPKGGVEAGESLLEAAKREIFEETGLRDVLYVRDLGSYERYSIGKGGVGEQTEYGLRKRTFFLFSTLERVLAPQDEEITQARWVLPEEALELLSHPKDREFFAGVVPVLQGLRTKTPEQVAHIEEAQQAAERALEEALAYLRSSASPTSEEARARIAKTLGELGYELPYGCIVAGGPQSAAPHHEGSGLLPRNAPIVIDIYPRSLVTGYFGDLSRTVCVGAPSPELQRMYDAVRSAQELAFSLLKPSRACADVQEAVERHFAQKGFMTGGAGDMKEGFPYSEGFVHSLGHGVGLAVHELPKIGKGKDVLRTGDVITIEPGLYYPAIGGVRIEDVVVITEEGYRNLTRAPKHCALE